MHGNHVAVRGDLIVVGAPMRNAARSALYAGDLEQRGADGAADTTSQHGAICIYRRGHDGWQGVATVEAPSPHGQYFGCWVGILEDGRIAVGAGLDSHGTDWSATPTHGGAHARRYGAVYLLAERTGDDPGWRVDGCLVSDPPGGGDEFGNRLAVLDGSTLVVASPNESSSGRGVDPQVRDLDAHESGCVRIIEV
jgi:hypothetical protein